MKQQRVHPNIHQQQRIYPNIHQQQRIHPNIHQQQRIHPNILRLISIPCVGVGSVVPVNLELPVPTPRHGDLVVPHVDVNLVELVVEDQIPGLVALRNPLNLKKIALTCQTLTHLAKMLDFALLSLKS